VYDSGMDERVMEVLAEQGVSGWTKWFGGQGGGATGLKLDTPIWPGTVNLLQIVLDESAIEPLTLSLRALQNSYRRNPGLMMWTQSVLVVP
jgi:hypothetical protein